MRRTLIILVFFTCLIFLASSRFFRQVKEVSPSELLAPIELYIPTVKRIFPEKKEEAVFSKNGKWTAVWSCVSCPNRPTHPDVALLVEHYDSPLRSFIEFGKSSYQRFFFAKGVFSRPRICPSELASSCIMACSVPTAGVFCRSVALYGQYLVIFQMNVQNASSREAEFLDVWKRVDKYISSALTPAD